MLHSHPNFRFLIRKTKLVQLAKWCVGLYRERAGGELTLIVRYIFISYRTTNIKISQNIQEGTITNVTSHVKNERKHFEVIDIGLTFECILKNLVNLVGNNNDKIQEHHCYTCDDVKTFWDELYEWLISKKYII